MDRIQLRRDSSARWAEHNPILLEGEVGYETDSKRRKIGDGIHNWNDLDYLAAENVVQKTGNSEMVVMSQAAVTRELAELGSEVSSLEISTIGKEINVTFTSAWMYIPLGFTIKKGSIVENVGDIDLMLCVSETDINTSFNVLVSSGSLVLPFDSAVIRCRENYGEAKLAVKSAIGKLEEEILNNTNGIEKTNLKIAEAEYAHGKIIRNAYVGVTSDNKFLSSAEGNYTTLIRSVTPNEKLVIYTDKTLNGDSLSAFTSSENPLLNAEKLPVNGKNNIELSVGYNEITVPENARYIAITLQFADSLGSPENKIVATYSEYGIIKQLRRVEDESTERYNELNDSKVGKKTINLFDKSKAQLVGKYIGTDGKLSSAETCIASYLIPIKPDTLYSWNADGSNMNLARFVASDGITGLNLLNEDGEELAYNGRHYGVIKSPTDAAYFQFTISFLGRLDIVDSACLIESDSFIDTYYNYGFYMDINELPNEYKDLPQRVTAIEKVGANNQMFGKSIYFCGDSIMNGLLVDADRRLYNQIANRYGMVANNKSLDGSVFFYPTNNEKESIYWQLSQIPSDADYIIIQGGVNGMNMTNPDSTPYFPMGEMTDSYSSDFDLSTQIGCVEAICKYLYDNFSGKKFGFIITYQISSRYDSYLNYWGMKADAFVEVLKKWGIPYIDWRCSGVNLAANAQNYGFSVLDYEEFSEDKDYKLDDRVRYNNIGYKAKVEITAGNPFNESQWQQLSTAAENHDTWHCNALAYDLLSYQTGKWIETL